MMLVQCHIGRSEIEGLGVFTDEPIPAGRTVWRFDRRFDLLVPLAELDRAPEHLRQFYDRFAYEMEEWPDHLALDGDDGRFMNHADDPNLDFSTPGIAVAARDIAPGEELTCDYGHLASREFEMQPPRSAI